MGLQDFRTGIGSGCDQNCDDGCGKCPDFVIKRHDTRPPLKVEVQVCDSTIDWLDTQLVLEANIWYNTKLKAAIAADAGEFALADNIGYEQMLPDDIIVVGGPRSPEMMLVTGFDENAKHVQVQRQYHATTARSWPKGTKMRVFRAMNAPATIENVYEDVLQEDGTTDEDELTGSYLVYQWQASDTCLPGCFMVEFKLMKMMEQIVQDQDVSQAGLVLPSGVTLPSEVTVPSDVAGRYGCVNGLGVEWVRRFPSDKEAFLVQIVDSPTAEL